jgi:hypothetical protein
MCFGLTGDNGGGVDYTTVRVMTARTAVKWVFWSNRA